MPSLAHQVLKLDLNCAVGRLLGDQRRCGSEGSSDLLGCLADHRELPRALDRTHAGQRHRDVNEVDIGQQVAILEVVPGRQHVELEAHALRAELRDQRRQLLERAERAHVLEWRFGLHALQTAADQ